MNEVDELFVTNDVRIFIAPLLPMPPKEITHYLKAFFFILFHRIEQCRYRRVATAAHVTDPVLPAFTLRHL